MHPRANIYSRSPSLPPFGFTAHYRDGKLVFSFGRAFKLSDSDVIIIKSPTPECITMMMMIITIIMIEKSFLLKVFSWYSSPIVIVRSTLSSVLSAIVMKINVPEGELWERMGGREGERGGGRKWDENSKTLKELDRAIGFANCNGSIRHDTHAEYRTLWNDRTTSDF